MNNFVIYSSQTFWSLLRSPMSGLLINVFLFQILSSSFVLMCSVRSVPKGIKRGGL